jgi:formylglycine-generating enzyme required for sulfatase activity
MTKDPAQRPASAGVVVQTLEALLASGLSSDEVPTQISAIPVARLKKAKPKPAATAPTRPKVYLWGGVASAACVVIVAALWIAGVFAGDDASTVTNQAGITGGPPAPAGELPTLLNTTDGAARLQTGQADQRGVPVETTNSIGMALRYIPSGSYLRGSTQEQIKWAIEQATAEGLFDRYGPYIESENSETWNRRARIDQPFYMATTEVTVGQFRAFVEATGYKTLAETDGIGGINFTTGLGELDANWDNPGMTQNDSHPVINLTQPDCIAFCDWLSEKEGVTYRLPKETEWEFACRAGSLGRWCFGDDPSAFYEYGWCFYNSPNSTKPVAGRKPNTFGLFDMHGNAREWVLLDDGSTTDETGTGVVRGGSFTKPQILLRSASRVGFKAKSPYPYHGFRVLREVESDQSP